MNSKTQNKVKASNRLDNQQSAISSDQAADRRGLSREILSLGQSSLAANDNNSSLSRGKISITIPRASAASSLGTRMVNNHNLAGKVQQQFKMKKSFVRFDDYLDLNEENMRRSCKRLMNHLYSSSADNAEALASASAPATNQKTSPTSTEIAGAEFIPAAGQTNQINELTQTAENESLMQGLPAPAISAPTTPAAGGKSYLRLQYERRQQRQLQSLISNKMQPNQSHQTQMPNGDEAKIVKSSARESKASVSAANMGSSSKQRQQQQQDLVVAKSHELSKRRFFERLENRNREELARRQQQHQNQHQSQSASTQASGEGQINLLAPLVAPAEQAHKLVSPDGTTNLAAGQKSFGSSDATIECSAAANNVGSSSLDARSSQCHCCCQAEHQSSELNFLASPNLSSAFEGRAVANCCCDRGQLIEIENSGSKSNLLGEFRANEFEIRVPGTLLEADDLLSSRQQVGNDNLIRGSSSASAASISNPGKLFVRSLGEQLEMENGVQVEGEVEAVSGRPAVGHQSAGANKMEIDVNDAATGKLVDLADREAGEAEASAAQLISSQESRTMDPKFESNSDLQAESQPSNSGGSFEAPGTSANSTANGAISNSKGSDEEEVGQTTGVGGISGQPASTGATDVCEASETTSHFEREANHDLPETPFAQSGGAGASSKAATILNGARNLAGHSASGGREQSYAAQGKQEPPSGAAHGAPTKSEQPVACGPGSEPRVTESRQLRDFVPSEAYGFIKSDANRFRPASELNSSGQQTGGGGEENSDCSSALKQQAQREPLKGNYSNVNSLEMKKLCCTYSTSLRSQRRAIVCPSNMESIEDLEFDNEEFDKSGPGCLISNEEDNGSSCGSSGFGASISAGSVDSSELPRKAQPSSSASSCSASGSMTNANSASLELQLQLQQLALASSHCNNPLYDAIGHHEIKRLNPYQANSEQQSKQRDQEFPDYKQLVGPDQAYPSKSSARSIPRDNHDYDWPSSSAKLLEESQAGLNNSIGADKSIILERDDAYLTVGYANLPISCNSRQPGGVEYATVRTADGFKLLLTGNSQNGHNDKNNCSPNESPTTPAMISSSIKRETCNSPTGSSSSSAGFGGFEALCPMASAAINSPSEARICNSLTGADSGRRPASNDGQQPASLNDNFLNDAHRQNSIKSKASILKRFGSLVSRAFISSASIVSSQTSNDLVYEKVAPAIGLQSDSSVRATIGAESQSESSKTTASSSPKPTIILDANQKEKLARRCEVKKCSLERAPNSNFAPPTKEADLIILAPKRLQLAPLEANKRQQPSSADDSLSRAKFNSRARKFAPDNRYSRIWSKRQRQLESVSSPSIRSSSSLESSLNKLKVVGRSSRKDAVRRRRADSLSEELESLMSASSSTSSSADEQLQQSSHRKQRVRPTELEGRAGRDRFSNGRRQAIIEIDCGDGQASSASLSDRNRDNQDGGRQSVATSSSASAKNRSFLKFLRLTSAGTSGTSTESSPNLSVEGELAVTKTAEATKRSGRPKRAKEGVSLAEPPPSGLWGFSSLMSYNHGKRNSADKLAKRIAEAEGGRRVEEPIYADNQPAIGNGKLSSIEAHYSLAHQQLIKRHSRRHHHHHHSRRGANRKPCHHYAMKWRRSNQYGDIGFQSDSDNNEQASGSRPQHVWGQLIKINKSKGSQVIELERAPGKCWGFFVARGAICNVRGIFISRIMDDEDRRSPLTGLLSVGDRLLAIDDHEIDQKEQDILKVNQLISKKSRILLEVKPFKG